MYGPVMTCKCIVTNKIKSFGNSKSIRGISKKKKGIGLKTTSITKRTFDINSFKKRIWSVSMKRFYTVRVSAKGLKMLDKLDVADFVKR
ncbi:MAG: 50S ribosomal protein L28 [Chlamydiia bacterium]|nr:50S ribosomal protein L28 [Chlamydiia bacterium]